MPFTRAPADFSLSASESTSPEYWRGFRAIWPCFATQQMLTRGRVIAPQTATGFSRDFTVNGPTQYNGTDDSTNKLEYSSGLIDSTGISEVTFVAWLRPDNPVAARGSAADTLLGSSSANDDGIRAFLAVTDETPRWRLPQAAGNVDISSTTLWNAGDLVQYVGRLGGGTQDLSIYNGTTGAEDSTSSATSASISMDEGVITLGNQVGSDSASYPGHILWAGLWFRRWTDSELLANREDIYAPFRRRRRFIPISVGGADITGSGSPQAGDATVIGTGERIITGTTTVKAQNATATGTGNRVITDQSSTVQAQPATASGSGTVGDAITGSGSAQAQDATATATGDRKIAGQGAPQAQAASATGVGERIITGTAAVQADPANASGTDTEEAFKAKLQPGVGYSRLYSYIKG